jgi:hypothetical protein
MNTPDGARRRAFGTFLTSDALFLLAGDTLSRTKRRRYTASLWVVVNTYWRDRRT